MPSIELRAIQTLGRHGVLSHERQIAQPFEVDLLLEYDFSEAASSDDLSKTIDYSMAAQVVVDIVENSQFALIETLAMTIAESLLARFPAESIEVAVRKLHPPMPVLLDYVGVLVRVERTHDSPGDQQ